VRAYAVERSGGTPAILDLPRPTSGDGYVVRVTYAGVTPLDYKLAENLTPQSAYPFVLGVDLAGVLEAVPSDERELSPGDRVFGIARTHGSYAEHTAVPGDGKAEALARIPESVADDQAAALVAAGQSFVVMGATGGVGGYAVQLARARGAHVIATVRRDADEAVRLGADEVHDSREVDPIDAIERTHPEGVDAVLDIVNGADAIRRDADILKADGRLVSTLYAADIPWFAERRVTAQSIASIDNPLASPQGLTELVSFLASGAITARIATTEPLANAGSVLDQLRNRGVHGKALIRP
jgi:NADPH2:quinone reductase